MNTPTPKIKAFYPDDLYFQEHRETLFELIKSRLRLEKEDRPIDRNIQEMIDWAESKKEADIWILPHDWQFYYARKKHLEALQFCQEAHQKGKKVLSFSGGDQGITVPVPPSTIVYRQSGYRSKRKENERTSPFFLSDPVAVFLKIDESLLFEKNIVHKPVVGFCGMAPHGILTGLKESAQIIKRNTKSLLGITKGDLQEVVSSSNLRFKTLEVFQQSPHFQDNYIIRQKYRGGVQTPENRKKTTEEYYQNQMDSDLIVCVRGVGNFSLRFFETLAMGRIPIFIDTDSPLPDISPKDWNDYIIWVDKKCINQAPEISEKWLAKRDLRAQQHINRQLWVEHFRLDNFWIRELNNLMKQESK